jgi:SH3-like domain-containing protein
MPGASTFLKIIAIVVAVVVLIAAVFVALTFPRTVVEFPVSFTIGIDREQRQIGIPWLHDKAQVEVAVTNGSSLWRASITNSSGDEVWSHSALQGEQTTYTSGWIAMSGASYNFTFSTIGAGSLDATIKIISKGGIW